MCDPITGVEPGGYIVQPGENAEPFEPIIGEEVPEPEPEPEEGA